MRGERNLIVLDAGDMLYDAFAVRRSPAQSCSASRFTAGVSAFFILSQSGRTGRQNPSASRLCLRGRGLQACENTVSPSPFCSLNRIPGPTLANTISSVALHTGPGPPPGYPEAAATAPPLDVFPTTRVTRGLRLPRRSTVISPAFSSLRSARRFASGWIPHSCSIRLETRKLLSRRSPLRCQSASPTNNALMPRRLA
jgi:hypothetical protein